MEDLDLRVSHVEGMLGESSILAKKVEVTSVEENIYLVEARDLPLPVKWFSPLVITR
jgi:hypothetical protein